MGDGSGPDFSAKFASLTADTKAILNDTFPVLEPEVDRILRAAYGAAGITNAATLTRLMGIERPHYAHLLKGAFGDEYRTLVAKLQAEHAALGIGMDSYFQGFTLILNEFSAVLVRKHKGKPDRVVPALAALNQAIFLEMDYTLSSLIQGIEAKAANERGSLADQLEQEVQAVVRGLGQSSTALRQAAQSLAGTASETQRLAGVVSDASARAAANVDAVAEATSKLSTSVSDINQHVANSSQLAQRGASEADRTNATIEGLSTGAQRIGEVVGLINNIASQTNLLALNATIEAARAGEAGKGFAVVANEVKSLANQTARATDDITAQVNAIQAAIEDTVTVIRAIGGTITDINGIAATIAEAVGEQGAVAADMSRNVQEAHQGAEAVATAIGKVVSAADQTQSAVGQLVSSAETVTDQSGRLEEAVRGFLARIRG